MITCFFLYLFLCYSRRHHPHWYCIEFICFSSQGRGLWIFLQAIVFKVYMNISSRPALEHGAWCIKTHTKVNAHFCPKIQGVKQVVFMWYCLMSKQEQRTATGIFKIFGGTVSLLFLLVAGHHAFCLYSLLCLIWKISFFWPGLRLLICSLSVVHVYLEDELWSLDLKESKYIFLWQHLLFPISSRIESTCCFSIKSLNSSSMNYLTEENAF